MEEVKPYLKMYIAVLEDVNDYMVPTLVAHSVLSAHLQFFKEPDLLYPEREPDNYYLWLTQSFRKCVIKINRKEFEKIKQLDNVYLGHENKKL